MRSKTRCRESKMRFEGRPSSQHCPHAIDRSNVYAALPG